MTVDQPTACFDLAFATDRRGRSFLDTQFTRYPVHICRGLYTNPLVDEACTVTLQSVSGGLFERDRIAGRLVVHAGAWAEVGTSASTVVHSMRTDHAEQHVQLSAGEGAYLEYLPEPLILFPTSRMKSTLHVCAAAGSTVLFSESFFGHDPTSQGRAFGHVDARVDIVDTEGKLLARERQFQLGDDWASRRVGVSNRFGVQGSVWIVRRVDDALLQALRDLLALHTVYAGASELPNRCGLQLRMLCADAVVLRRVIKDVQAAVQAHSFRERRQQPGMILPSTALEVSPLPLTVPIPA